MRALWSRSLELLFFCKGMKRPQYGLFHHLGYLFQWQCKVIRNSVKITFFKNIYIYLLHVPSSRTWWREGLRDRYIIGSFSSFTQPVVDLEVQGLLRQNENDSQKTGMWSFRPFFLVRSWKGLLWTSSSLPKEWSDTMHTAKRAFCLIHCPVNPKHNPVQV